jgi:hypothetical protein
MFGHQILNNLKVKKFKEARAKKNLILVKHKEMFVLLVPV